MSVAGWRLRNRVSHLRKTHRVGAFDVAKVNEQCSKNATATIRAHERVSARSVHALGAERPVSVDHEPGQVRTSV